MQVIIKITLYKLTNVLSVLTKVTAINKFQFYYPLEIRTTTIKFCYRLELTSLNIIMQFKKLNKGCYAS